MIIICGKTIAEVEHDLEMAKRAIASGMPYGVGGATIEDAEKGLEMMRSMLGDAVEPISNPNYIAPDPWEDVCDCECECCDGYCDDECDCDCCGGYEDEVEEAEDEYIESIIASAERLGIPMEAIHAWINAWID